MSFLNCLSVLDSWQPLNKVAETCGFFVVENYEEVIVKIPYNQCLEKEVMELHSANIVSEEMTLVSTLRMESTS